MADGVTDGGGSLEQQRQHTLEQQLEQLGQQLMDERAQQQQQQRDHHNAQQHSNAQLAQVVADCEKQLQQQQVPVQPLPRGLTVGEQELSMTGPEMLVLQKQVQVLTRTLNQQMSLKEAAESQLLSRAHEMDSLREQHKRDLSGMQHLVDQTNLQLQQSLIRR